VAAIYLSAQQLIPEDRVAEAMSDLFGVHLLCPPSVASWNTAKAEELKPVVDHIRALMDRAAVRHLDETGFRISRLFDPGTAKLQWLHTVSTLALTHYRVSEKRGEIPTTLVGGIIVHEHFKPYFTLPGETWGVQRAPSARVESVDRD
jgi:hypothetical protein